MGDDSSSINLMSLLENYWSKSGDQVVNGEIIINGDLIVDHLIAHNLVSSNFTNIYDSCENIIVKGQYLECKYYISSISNNSACE